MKSTIIRILLIGIGWLSIALGVLGIVLPVLPTVPFLLLAAACFARSSERFHRWLIHHVYLGPMVRDYLDGQGVSLKSKVMAIILIWLSIGVSVVFLIPVFWVKVLVIGIAACVTFYLIRLPLRPEQ